MPLTSIIVPCFNQIDYTMQLLESIETYTPEEHEIILIDNASTDDTLPRILEYAQTRPHVRVIENKTNLGFPKAVNQGFALAKGDYFCVVNTDVVVTPEWLKGMIYLMEYKDRVGIVGCRTNNVSGPQIFMDGKYSNLFQLVEFSREFRKSYLKSYTPFYRIVFFCALINRKLYDEIGGLDEQFTPGNFEDDDYCLRALLAGWRTLFCNDVFVHHYGGASHDKASFNKILTINQIKFEAKWRKWLKEHSRVSCCSIFRNEEKHMETFLDNILPLVDEVILVDTGSTDRSREIVTEYMRRDQRIKLYDFAWTDDFSEARNFSIEQATGDWIMIMDIDEVIPQFTKSILQPCTAYLIETRNYSPVSTYTGWVANRGEYPEHEVGCGWFPSTKIRLFPNDKRIRFEFPVHEVCDTSIYHLGLRVKRVHFPVHHYGRMNLEVDHAKGTAYLKYLDKLIAENSNDLRSVEEIATQLQNLHRFEEAITYWNKYRDLIPDNDATMLHNYWLNVGHNYACLHRFEEALAGAEKALACNPKSREAASNRSVCLFWLGRYAEAAEAAKDVLEKHPDYPTAMAIFSAARTKLSEQAGA